MIDTERFSDLRQKYPIEKRFNKLYRQIVALIKESEFKGSVVLNEDILGAAVIDYFEDVDRLKEFSGIPRISVSKIYSYQTYWLLRRRPIQIVNDSISDDRCLYINEIFMAMILINDMFSEKGIILSSGDQKVGSFFDLLLYNFKYREYTQKSLEIMIEAFFLGHDVK